MSRAKSSARSRFTGAALLLALLIFLVPAVRSGDSRLYLLAVLIPCVMLLCGTVVARIFSLDRLLLMLSLFLCMTGIAALALSDPESALFRASCCGAGIILLIIGAVLIRSLSGSVLTALVSGFLGLLLLISKLLSPSLDLPVTFPALAFLLLAFAALLSREGPISAAVLGITVTALLLLRNDAADAVLWGVTILLLLFAADGRLFIVLPVMVSLLLLYYGAFFLLPQASLSWSTATPEILVSAGLFGTDTLPENYAAASACLFPLLSGHYGLFFAGLSVLMFLPFTLRGTTVASCARTRFHAVLAMGISLLLALYTLSSLLFEFGFLPFAGSGVPLLTRSLPALGSQLFLIGMLCGISGRNDADLAEDAHLAMLAK